MTFNHLSALCRLLLLFESLRAATATCSGGSYNACINWGTDTACHRAQCSSISSESYCKSKGCSWTDDYDSEDSGDYYDYDDDYDDYYDEAYASAGLVAGLVIFFVVVVAVAVGVTLCCLCSRRKDREAALPPPPPTSQVHPPQTLQQPTVNKDPPVATAVAIPLGNSSRAGGALTASGVAAAATARTNMGDGGDVSIVKKEVVRADGSRSVITRKTVTNLDGSKTVTETTQTFDSAAEEL